MPSKGINHSSFIPCVPIYILIMSIIFRDYSVHMASLAMIIQRTDKTKVIIPFGICQMSQINDAEKSNDSLNLLIIIKKERNFSTLTTLKEHQKAP